MGVKFVSVSSVYLKACCIVQLWQKDGKVAGAHGDDALKIVFVTHLTVLTTMYITTMAHKPTNT